MVALCTSLLKRSVRGGLIIVGEVNLGGSIETIYNAVAIAEIDVIRKPDEFDLWIGRQQA